MEPLQVLGALHMLFLGVSELCLEFFNLELQVSDFLVLLGKNGLVLIAFLQHLRVLIGHPFLVVEEVLLDRPQSFILFLERRDLTACPDSSIWLVMMGLLKLVFEFACMSFLLCEHLLEQRYHACLVVTLVLVDILRRRWE